jgi:hypothetical protein
MNITLTKQKGILAFTVPDDFFKRFGDWGNGNGKTGKALLEINWKRTTRGRVIARVSKKSSIYLG